MTIPEKIKHFNDSLQLQLQYRNETAKEAAVKLQEELEKIKPIVETICENKLPFGHPKIHETTRHGAIVGNYNNLLIVYNGSDVLLLVDKYSDELLQQGTKRYMTLEELALNHDIVFALKGIEYTKGYLDTYLRSFTAENDKRRIIVESLYSS